MFRWEAGAADFGMEKAPRPVKVWALIFFD
jgi:hypothetical protein